MQLNELLQETLLIYENEWKEPEESEESTSLNKAVIEGLTTAFIRGVQDGINGILKPDDREFQLNLALKMMEQNNITANEDFCHEWIKTYLELRYQMYRIGYENGLNRQNRSLLSAGV